MKLLNTPPAKSLDGIYKKLQQGFSGLCHTLVSLFPRHNSHISFLLDGDSDSFVFDPSLTTNQIAVIVSGVPGNYSYNPHVISYTILEGTATVDSNGSTSALLPAGLSESIEVSDTLITPFEITPDTGSSQVYVSIIY
jgi:hypothetical protein